MIKLYISESCPFCQKVLHAAARSGIKEGTDFITIHADPGTAGRKEVLDLGGTSMVPFLVDGRTSMYESDDIIIYLRKKFDRT